MKNVYLFMTLCFISLFSACITTADSAMTNGGQTEKYLYRAGTYKGNGDGYFGLISVMVTVTENAVTEVEILSHADTDGIGTAAFEELSQTIIHANSSDVDVVSGATGSSEGFIAAVNDALSRAKLP